MRKKLVDDIANLAVYKLANASLPSEKLYRPENGYIYSLIFSYIAMFLFNIFPDFFDSEEILNAARIEFDKKLDRSNSIMEKDANRRINRLKSVLHMKDGEGVWVHAIRTGEFDRKTGKYKNLLNKDKIIDLMKSYVDDSGKAKVVAPAYLVGTNQQINAETN